MAVTQTSTERHVGSADPAGTTREREPAAGDATTDLVDRAAMAAWSFVTTSEAWATVARDDRLRAAEDPTSPLGRAWADLRAHLEQPDELVRAIAERLLLPTSPPGPHDVRARVVASHNLGNIVPAASHGSAVRLARLLAAWGLAGDHRVVELCDGRWATGRGIPLHSGTVDAVRITVCISTRLRAV